MVQALQVSLLVTIIGFGNGYLEHYMAPRGVVSLALLHGHLGQYVAPYDTGYCHHHRLWYMVIWGSMWHHVWPRPGKLSAWSPSP